MNERILEILRQLETEFPGHPVYQINVGGNTWTITRNTTTTPSRREDEVLK